MKQIPLLAILGFVMASTLGFGCFHKDVETDRADDIAANLIYEGPEGKYILSKEAIFQASSKESNGGVTHISGHTEFRLSSYVLATGELAGRVFLGEQMEEANELLGWTEGKVWMFSIDPELGLHYRDPRTLEVVKAWPELSKLPGLSSLKPALPDWPLISQFYTLDWELGKLMLTDEGGFRYILDPGTFALEKTELEMPRVEWEWGVLSNSGQFQPDKSAYLEDDPRKKINYLGKLSGSALSFLFGEFLLDKDPGKAAQRKVSLMDSLNRVAQVLSDSLKAYEAAHPEATQEPDWSKWSYEQRRIHDQAISIRRAIDDLKRDIDNRSGFHGNVLDSPFLTDNGQSAYILHANVISDTAHSILSRVDLLPDSTWKESWRTDFPKLYRNTSKAGEAGAFDKVFSKGNPSFDYRWAGEADGILVLVSQLRMMGVEMKTGKILWDIEL